jgi:hypothetical protein
MKIIILMLLFRGQSSALLNYACDTSTNYPDCQMNLCSTQRTRVELFKRRDLLQDSDNKNSSNNNNKSGKSSLRRTWKV